jgi:hypothetical protein
MTAPRIAGDFKANLSSDMSADAIAQDCLRVLTTG